jgi:hypothetical protein
VEEALSVVQRAIIVQGTADRAKIVYALGRNPKRLQELAMIEDPVRFAIEIGKVSALMKVTTRKPAVTPEAGVRGGAPGFQQPATRTDALLKKAQTTGIGKSGEKGEQGGHGGADAHHAEAGVAREMANVTKK